MAAKGGSSENKGKFVMMNPSDSMGDWVYKTVPTASTSWCPPGMLGLGIARTAEQAVLPAKEVLMEDIDISDLLACGPQYGLKELRITPHQNINTQGISAQGLGICPQ